MGDREAQCDLAVADLDGRGIERNIRKGTYWMKRAARLGDSFAQYNLGRSYLDSQELKRDERLAKLWLRKAARGAIGKPGGC